MANYVTVMARGISQSANAMRRKGIDEFNTFLTSKDMGAWDNLLPEQFTIELLQQFGTFMCLFLMKKDRSGYSLASIEKYLSGVTIAAQEDVRFKSLDLRKDKIGMRDFALFCLIVLNVEFERKTAQCDAEPFPKLLPFHHQLP